MYTEGPFGPAYTFSRLWPHRPSRKLGPRSPRSTFPDPEGGEAKVSGVRVPGRPGDIADGGAARAEAAPGAGAGRPAGGPARAGLRRPPRVHAQQQCEYPEVPRGALPSPPGRR